MIVEIAPHFERATTDLADLEARTHVAMLEAVHLMAQAAADILSPAIAAHTPVVTGTLRDSTAPEIEGAGLERTVTIHQPAQNRDGTEYVKFVAITDDNPAPVTKHYYGNRYALDAEEETRATIEAAMNAIIEAQLGTL